MGEPRKRSQQLGSQNVKDIRRQISGKGQRLDRAAQGSIELSYMRGFQAGYEQACKDAKRGKLNRANALVPSRAEKRAGKP